MKDARAKAGVPIRLVKLTAEIPADVDTRLYALAGMLGVPKRRLVATLLDAGLRRYGADRAHRELIAGMVAPVDPIGPEVRAKMTGS